ncbi:MAG: ABC transporter ATP-binding protein [Gemmataceae bacterium]|nr:ABC transporter ATP-binding protein [Gemmataceae bacterium]MDW8242117.1 ABC transporter ATP-binding protein [Thermogemmata sp.]
MTLVVDGLGKDYPTRSGPLVVLREISLTLRPGDALAIMGPSGSGKSTLLHILGTLDSPTRGRVTLQGVDPFALSHRELATFRNRHIGFVFQDHHLLPQCNVLENVLVPTLVSDRAPADNERRARLLLERVGLAQRLEHRPAELSGGERQRVALARALILQPLLVLADEPTGNLDADNAATVADLLWELHCQENNILIVVTHSWEVARRFPRQAELRQGTLHDVSYAPKNIP